MFTRFFTPAKLGCFALPLLISCGPIIRDAPFVGTSDKVTAATLLGPFDGHIVDATTGEPIADAIVLGVWSYDRGQGFIAPYGSETVQIVTDKAGRYQIPETHLSVKGSSVRLVSFHLLVYKRGYAAYRSNLLGDGQRRRDFRARHNSIRLKKWATGQSHSDHLLVLTPPEAMAKAVRWEQQLANMDLYIAQGGVLPGTAAAGTSGALARDQEPQSTTLLDASRLLSIEEIQSRTGGVNTFVIKELGGVPHSSFYQGIHFEGPSEANDVAFRVWHRPPGGLENVETTIKNLLPGVESSDEVTATTWVYNGESIRAVGFMDPESQSGVLLTCGVEECVDIDTTIILAKLLHDNLDRLRTVTKKDLSSSSVPASEGQSEGSNAEESAKGPDDGSKTEVPDESTGDDASKEPTP